MKFSKPVQPVSKASITLIISLALTACGGGGGGGGGGNDSGTTPTTPTNPTNPTTSAPTNAATASLNINPVKTFNFSWTDVSDATFYRVLENPDGSSGFNQISGDIASGVQSFDHEVALYDRTNASYIVQSCNDAGCVDGTTLNVTGTLENAIGYFKASNTEAGDLFGNSMAISGDGNTLAIGTEFEDSDATTINGANNNNGNNTGAVYVFAKINGNWAPQAYIKGTNNTDNGAFGISLSLSTDGNTLAVGAQAEGTGGSAYIFTRSGSIWTETRIITGGDFPTAGDEFGASVSLSGDGATLAVGAPLEDSDGLTENNDNTPNSGAVYIYTSASNWVQQAVIKANSGNIQSGDLFGSAVSLSLDGTRLAVTGDIAAGNTGAVFVYTATGPWAFESRLTATLSEADDRFGTSISLDADGNTLAVGAQAEDSDTMGINTTPNNNGADNGAAYIFTRSGNNWSQTTYIKASNSGSLHRFGSSIDISDDGLTVVVGAPNEQGGDTGVNANPSNTAPALIGAAYVFKNNSGWSQTAYLKTKDLTPTVNQEFLGTQVQVSGDANSVAASAISEDSNATGVGGDETNNSADQSGSVFLY